MVAFLAWKIESVLICASLLPLASRIKRESNICCVWPAGQANYTKPLRCIWCFYTTGKTHFSFQTTVRHPVHSPRISFISNNYRRSYTMHMYYHTTIVLPLLYITLLVTSDVGLRQARRYVKIPYRTPTTHQQPTNNPPTTHRTSLWRNLW